MRFFALVVWILILAMAFATIGCGSVVASSDIRKSRIRLNDAIQYTTEKQFCWLSCRPGSSMGQAT
jgi:putative exporter of polyketide antibiotics